MTAFIILVLFTAGVHNSDWRRIDCADLKCVHNVLDHVHDSKSVSKVRVWSGAEFGYFGHGSTGFLPFIDLTFG